MAEVKDIQVTVAPFYDTTARQFADMPEDERMAIRENFFHNAAFLAELCGLSFNSDIESQNVGGFVNEQGNRLVEISHTFSFQEIDKEKVDLFAALMAEFGYQSQESTISACYCERDDNDYTTQEYTIFCSHLESIDKIICQSGIYNFTVNTRERTISILAWDEKDQEHIVKLISKLKEYGYYKKDQEKSVNSRYLDRSERAELYKGWLQNGTRLSEMVSSKNKDGEQYRGIPQVGIQEPGASLGGLRECSKEDNGITTSRKVRRFRCLCGAIQEAYRRLEKGCSNVKKYDLFLANLERKLRYGDNLEIEAERKSFIKSIYRFEKELNQANIEKEEYKGAFYRIINDPEALAEFRERELNRYKAYILKGICDSLDKLFVEAPFTGVDIEFQYPPYAEGYTQNAWRGHGMILSVTISDANGQEHHWSMSEHTLDADGNHILKTGATFNVNTGQYREAKEKIDKEWNTTKNILKQPKQSSRPERKPGGIHR